MNKRAKLNVKLLLISFTIILFAGCVGGIDKDMNTEKSTLVYQDLNYTENPIDIPNPDRGFYRANDGMVVPVSGIISEDIINVGNDPINIGDAEVTTRVSHIYFDLRNFSTNAFTEYGTQFNEEYFAPENVSIGTREGDSEPYDYETHFDYWKENVLPTWKHGESQPLTEDALYYIKDKLQQVRDGNGVTLIRFNYDGEGFAWVDAEHPDDGYIDQSVGNIEPDKDTLLKQISQLKPLLYEYEDIILGVDGGMFGPWGEMHSTTYGTDPNAYAWLLNGWLDTVPTSRSIIVQAGAFLSWYNDTYKTNYTFNNIDKMPAPKLGTPESRFGFFNDSYGYGEDEGDNYPNDWGSLSEGAGWPGNLLGDEDSFDRGKVMTWIRKQNNFYGGEAQGGETLWNTYPFVAWEASYAQTVYLNADYDAEVHERWSNFEYNKDNVLVQITNGYEAPYNTQYAIFDPIYNGKTGAEYWRDRLGFRLVLRESNINNWVDFNGILSFKGKIQNVGFGNIVNKKNVYVILKAKDNSNTYMALTELDARNWKPNLDSRADNIDAYSDLSFSINMNNFGDVLANDYNIYLKINDPKETDPVKRSIQFANYNIWDSSIGGNLIGSTTIKR